MSVSLFREALGKACRESNFFNQPAEKNVVAIFAVGEAVVHLFKHTLMAVEKGKYTRFDALIKNKGCQINAMLVNSLVRDKIVLDEINTLIPEVKEKCDAMPTIFSELPKLKGNPEKTWDKKADQEARNQVKEENKKMVNDLIDRMDVAVSPAIAQLVRLRILTVVNACCNENGRETQRTNFEALQNKVCKVLGRRSKKIIPYVKKNFPFKVWVQGLQMEESKRAISFIQDQAQMLQCERALKLQHLVGNDFVRKTEKQTPEVVNLPEHPTIEIAVEQFTGVICVQNKLQIGKIERKDAKVLQVFVQKSGNTLLANEEIEQLPQTTPVLVMECFISEQLSKEGLQDMLIKHGIVKFACATGTRVRQYLKKTTYQGEQIKAITEDATIYKTAELDEVYRIAQIDHIFLAGIHELKGDKK